MPGYSVVCQIVPLADVLLLAFPIDRSYLFSCHHICFDFFAKVARLPSDYNMHFFGCLHEKTLPDCKFSSAGETLTLATIHSAKGLEWDNVFVVGLSEGIFPNPWFVKNKSEIEKAEFFNEELKLLYVAATRTRRNLFFEPFSSQCIRLCTGIITVPVLP